MSEINVLRDGAITLLGQHPEASNAVFIVDVLHEGQETRAIYKPVSGERPLWDFPEGTLAQREVATFVLARVMGFDFVPETVWIDSGPAGPGSLQRWIDGASIQDVLVDTRVHEGWLHVLDAELTDGTPVALMHRDDVELRALAYFDALLNNGDRKGGHILRDADGRLVAVDHGVTFHEEPRLRTVLWGFAGQPISEELLRRGSLIGDALSELRTLLSDAEIAALQARASALITSRVYPGPSPTWPAIPWPVY